MKHRLLTTLTAALLVLSAWANGTEINGIYYELNSEDMTASVTYTGSNYWSDNNYLGDITIPATVTYGGTTYSVTSVGNLAFFYCEGLTSITIPNSVTSIWDQAFYLCTGLTSITIPSSVTSIGGGAFEDCNSLTSITIPESVTSIGYGAFIGCSGLTSIEVETGNTEYDSRDNCNAIIETASNTLVAGCKTTTIPSSVTSIGGGAFKDCNSLTSITIPSSVTSIGEWAFLGCTSLTSITIRWDDPTNCTYGSSMLDGVPTSATLYVPVGTKALYENTEPWSSFENIVDTENNGIYYNLDSTAKTATVTYTGSDYWYDNNYSGDITIPATVTYGGTTYSVTSIGEGAFTNCSGLTSITIPSSVTSIGKNAFYGCTGLTSITIPSSVTSIGREAFSRCTGLTSIKVETGNTKYDSRDNCNAIIETATNTLIAGCKASTIPNSVTSIGYRAFGWCKDLTSITIPESVTSIGSGAFGVCTGLTSITIPNSVTTIGSEAFTSCTGLTSINIPNSVTSIGSYAFAWCSGLTSITIPNSVTSIDRYAFEYCSGLTSITIPNSVTSIGLGAFLDCSGLTSITIPNSVTSIGQDAFEYCSGLTSITIPNSVTSIGNSAFSRCTGLTSISIPESVTSIGNSAFSRCTGLTSIKVETGNTKYDSRDNCNAIIETATNTLIAGCNATTIPNSVTSISASAFAGCTGLTSINIPNSVTSIGNNAFYGCSGLTSITLSWDDPTNCTYGSNILYRVPTSATLYVPAGTKALYENTEPWSSFENIVERKSVITLSNTMGTYCDASGLDFSSVEGLEAYTATGYASGEVTLTRVNYVPANTGIVLRGTAGVYEVPQQKVNAYLMNLLKGTTSPITLNQTEGDMTNYILANGSKGIGFYKVASGGGTLAANKAYLQLPSNLSATRPMMLRFEDEDGQTTDIQYLYTSSDDETSPAIFDLQGRRVSGTMQQGGIYIVGGKKVMAK